VNACGLVDDCGQAINCGPCPSADVCNADTHRCESKNPVRRRRRPVRILVDPCGVAINCGSCPTTSDGGTTQICDARRTSASPACPLRAPTAPASAESSRAARDDQLRNEPVRHGRGVQTRARTPAAAPHSPARAPACATRGRGVSDGCGGILHNCAKCPRPHPGGVRGQAVRNGPEHVRRRGQVRRAAARKRASTTPASARW